LRAEWIALRRSLSKHIAYLKAGNTIHPFESEPRQATGDFVLR
jgi:hypothetical protein